MSDYLGPPPGPCLAAVLAKCIGYFRVCRLFFLWITSANALPYFLHVSMEGGGVFVSMWEWGLQEESQLCKAGANIDHQLDHSWRTYALL